LLLMAYRRMRCEFGTAAFPAPGGTVTRARSFADQPYIDDGAALLTEIHPGAIAYCFTSSSYVLGPEGDAALKARLETKTKGILVTLTCLAAVSALLAIGARRVALIHPPWFADDVALGGKKYFEHQGFDIVYHARAALHDTGPNTKVVGYGQLFEKQVSSR
jgi:maleate isomerase